MIALYRLLPLLLQLKDRAYSGGAPWNLEKWVGCIEDQANATEEQIKGLCDLIDPDLCPPEYLARIAHMIGQTVSGEWSDSRRRMVIKGLGFLAHISGTYQSWKAALRLDGKPEYSPVELYKSKANEVFDYSLSYDYAHMLKSARVDLRAPGDDPSARYGLLTEGKALEPYRPIHVLVRIDGQSVGETESASTPTEAEVSVLATFTIQETATAPGSENDELTVIQMWTISGTIEDIYGAGIAGVEMIGMPGNIVTASAGSYSAVVTAGWYVVVSPTLAGYTFTPASMSYPNIGSDQNAQNYIATAITYTISGFVVAGGAGVAGVELSGFPSGTAITGADGSYSATVPYRWSGTVTPALSGYIFAPTSITYTHVMSNQTTNYLASA